MAKFTSADDLVVWITTHNTHEQGGRKSHLYDWSEGKVLCGKVPYGTAVSRRDKGLTTFADVLDENSINAIRKEFCATCLKIAISRLNELEK